MVDELGVLVRRKEVLVEVESAFRDYYRKEGRGEKGTYPGSTVTTNPSSSGTRSRRYLRSGSLDFPSGSPPASCTYDH